MFNTYVVMLWLFLLGGLAVMSWGWAVIVAARRTLSWPHVEGVIERCELASDEDDLLPTIVFSYTVNGDQKSGKLDFPAGTVPTPEFSARYLERYPAGSTVKVFYNPVNSEQTTLEPGMGQGDWMIFALGAAATVAAIVSLIVGN